MNIKNFWQYFPGLLLKKGLYSAPNFTEYNWLWLCVKLNNKLVFFHVVARNRTTEKPIPGPVMPSVSTYTTEVALTFQLPSLVTPFPTDDLIPCDFKYPEISHCFNGYRRKLCNDNHMVWGDQTSSQMPFEFGELKLLSKWDRMSSQMVFELGMLIHLTHQWLRFSKYVLQSFGQWAHKRTSKRYISLLPCLYDMAQQLLKITLQTEEIHFSWRWSTEIWRPQRFVNFSSQWLLHYCIILITRHALYE